MFTKLQLLLQTIKEKIKTIATIKYRKTQSIDDDYETTIDNL